MKILLVAGLYYPAKLGGPANTLFWLSKALLRHGHEVCVVTSSHQIDDPLIRVNQWNNIEGVRVRYCKTRNKLGLPIVRWAKKECKSADVVVLSSIFYLPNILVARYARKKVKIIWSPRGELLGPAIAGNQLKRLYMSIVRRYFGKYVLFHATSEEEKKAINHYVGESARIVVIPNYIELPPQLASETPAYPYFLFVGRVTPIKAIDKLIIGLSMANLFKKSKYKLIIAGPNQNNYQKELERLAKSSGLAGKIEFVGNVFGEEKFRLYANAYFSCLLSFSENFGNVVIEALSQGTPVIASTGTPWDILEKANAGYWISNAPETIAEYIDKAIALPNDDYSKMRNAARLLADSFDVNKNIHNWMEVLKLNYR